MMIESFMGRPFGKEATKIFSTADMAQLQQQVTGHGNIAQGHDQDEPEDTFYHRLFAPGHPEPEEEESAVGIGQGGPEPWIGPELASCADNVLVQRGANSNIQHDSKQQPTGSFRAVWLAITRVI
jgi:hypothetical protein